MAVMDIPLVLKYHYPTAIWGGSAADYSKLNWKDTTIPKPTEAELLSLWSTLEVQLRKTERIKELASEAEAQIVAGFWSSALGTPKFYTAGYDDQLNLIGVRADNTDTYFSCKNLPTDIQKTYYLHTAAMIQQVFADGKNFKLMVLQQFNNLKDQILSPTTDTIAKINSIVWTPVIDPNAP